MPSPTPSSPTSVLLVTAAHTGQRIDNFLTTQLKGLPKSRLYRAVRSGEVRVNKKRVKASYRLQEGDEIRIPPLRLSSPKEITPPSTNFLQLVEKTIILETKDIIIINKPSGVASHGGSGIRMGAIEGFRHLRPHAKFLELAHRLDRDTTGCLILAKKPSILKELHRLFLTGGVKKTYLALVEQSWEGGTHLVDAPLRKNTLSSGERIVRVDPQSKPAKTIFKPLKIFPEATFIEASPLTGRTHQIRVHAAHLGHPILGDEKYSHRQDQDNNLPPIKHLLLHAASLQFELSGQFFAVSACLDTEFKRVLGSVYKKLKPIPYPHPYRR